MGALGKDRIMPLGLIVSYMKAVFIMRQLVWLGEPGGAAGAPTWS